MSITDQMPLFWTPPVEVAEEPTTAGGKQRAWLRLGRHPATRMLLHPDAPRVTEPGEPGDGPRCRDCIFLTRKVTPSGRAFLKCRETPFVYDMRGWWPACHAFKGAPDVP